MRWLKRFVWLSAWGFWAWLGFGLYRELPRSLGPLVCQIPVEKPLHVVGFVGDTNRLAFRRDSPMQTYEIKLFDAETGSPIDLPIAWLRQDIVLDFPGLVRRGFMLSSVEFSPNVIEVRAGLQCVDLETGESRRLTKAPVIAAALHDQQPWLAVSERATKGDSEVGRVVVIDLESGRELFSRGVPEGRRIERRSFFIPGTDKLVIPTPAALGTESRTDGGVEIWNIGPPAVLEKFVKGMTIQLGFTASRNGRIAQWPRGSVSPPVVLDLNEERVVFSLPIEELDFVERGIPIPRISPSGKTVLVGEFGTLYDVDSGRVVWRPGPGEMAMPDVFPNTFLTIEDWSTWWKQWFPNYQYTSTTFRDIETGRLIVRLKGITGNLYPNRAGTLVATTTGAVHRLPYVVNWPLLALCQAVLALPLVMLWFVLRLRRRRKLRHGTGVPRNSAV